MSSRDESPTPGEMLGEVLDLLAGLGILVLPLFPLAIPALILLLPLALLALPLAILAAPFVLIAFVRRHRAARAPTAAPTHTPSTALRRPATATKP